jgi:uncharacterized protein
MENFIFRVSDFLKTNTIEIVNEKFNLDLGYKHSILVFLKVNKMSDDSLYVSGTLKGSISLECSRCLFVYEHPIDIKIEKEMTFLNDIVDIGDELRQTLILELPMIPLCKTDCQGIPYVEASNSEFLKERWNSLLKQN